MLRPMQLGQTTPGCRRRVPFHLSSSSVFQSNPRPELTHCLQTSLFMDSSSTAEVHSLQHSLHSVPIGKNTRTVEHIHQVICPVVLSLDASLVHQLPEDRRDVLCSTDHHRVNTTSWNFSHCSIFPCSAYRLLCSWYVRLTLCQNSVFKITQTLNGNLTLLGQLPPVGKLGVHPSSTLNVCLKLSGTASPVEMIETTLTDVMLLLHSLSSSDLAPTVPVQNNTHWEVKN